MSKIDLTGKENGNFVVLREIEPIYDSNGKKKARWVCECKICHEKEVIFGESIRRNRHKFCTSCVRTDEARATLEKTVADINKNVIAAGYKPITKRQFINAIKFIHGSLAPEDENDLPEFINYFEGSMP